MKTPEEDPLTSRDEDRARTSEAGKPMELSSGSHFYETLLVSRLGDPPGRLPIRLVLFFFALTWLPLAILSAANGAFVGKAGSPPGFLNDLAVQVRLLLGLPTLLLIEPFIRGRLTVVFRYVDQAELLSGEDRAVWNARLDTIRRLRDSNLIDGILLLGAAAVSVLGTFSDRLGVQAHGLEWRWELGSPSPAGWWYALVASPVILFHVFRWLYRLLLWMLLLRRLSRLHVQIRPAHPDLSGGLAVLSLGSHAFSLVFSALAIMVAGSLASEILRFGHSVFEYTQSIGVFLISSLAVLFGPLLAFAPRARRARDSALAEYGAAGNALIETFEGVWLPGAWSATLDGSVDPSVMADYSSVYDNVRTMRIVPINLQMLLTAIAQILLPFLPLLLTAMSWREILERIVKAVM